MLVAHFTIAVIYCDSAAKAGSDAACHTLLKGNKTFAMGSPIEFTFSGDVAQVFAKESGKNLEFSNDTTQE